LKGDYIGDAQVAYIGTSGNFYPSRVVANTHYYIKVFSFNGYPAYENYLTDSNYVAKKDTVTPANMIGQYYSGINTASATLWNDLHTLINNHFAVYYSDYDNYLVKNFESRDTVVSGMSKKTITCSYSGENYVYSEPFAFTTYSREHVFCESWMPTYNNTGYTSLPEYADYHNLLPVNQNKINSYRSYYPLGKVVTIQYQYLDGKMGLDSLNHVVFEPRDKIKGDCARAMFYLVLSYDGISGNDWYIPVQIDPPTVPYGQDEALLKKWNHIDPPDDYEMARNDFIASIQYNRNPFIDHPEWADLFGFGVNSSIEMASDVIDDIMVFPNPAKEQLIIKAGQIPEVSFMLYDMSGKLLFSVPVSNGYNNVNLTIRNIGPGIYFYELVSGDIKPKRSKIIILPN